MENKITYVDLGSEVVNWINYVMILTLYYYKESIDWFKVLLERRHTWCRSCRSAHCSLSQWRCASTHSWSACFVSAFLYSPAFVCLRISVSTCLLQGGDTWQTASKLSGIWKNKTLLNSWQKRSKLQNICILIISNNLFTSCLRL